MSIRESGLITYPPAVALTLVYGPTAGIGGKVAPTVNVLALEYKLDPPMPSNNDLQRPDDPELFLSELVFSLFSAIPAQL